MYKFKIEKVASLFFIIIDSNAIYMLLLKEVMRKAFKGKIVNELIL